MSIVGIIGFMFFYLAIALIFYSLCVTASRADDLMEKQYKKVQSYEEFWHTEYVCRGEQNAK